jgi:hypothetical protein
MSTDETDQPFMPRAGTPTGGKGRYDERKMLAQTGQAKPSTEVPTTHCCCNETEVKGLYKLAVTAAQQAGIAEEALNLLKGYLDDDTAGGYSRKAVRKRYRELRAKLDELCDFAS